MQLPCCNSGRVFPLSRDTTAKETLSSAEKFHSRNFELDIIDLKCIECVENISKIKRIFVETICFETVDRIKFT